MATITTKQKDCIINEVSSAIVCLDTSQGIKHLIMIPENRWAEKGSIQFVQEDNGKKVMKIEIPIKEYLIV